MSFLGDLTPTDFELLLCAVESSSHNNDADDTSGIRRRPHRNEKEYRRRKREERARLRYEVEMLESELERRQRDALTPRTSTQTTALTWKRMATQQFKSRRHAERQNATLRRTLERQLQVVRQFERLFHKQTSHQDWTVGTRGVIANAVSHSTALFPDYWSDTPWAQVDVVFAEIGFHEISTDLDDLEIRAGIDGALPCVQIRHVRVLPFDWGTTSSTVWELDTIMPIAKANYEVKLWTDGVVVVQYETPTCVGRVEVTLVGELTVRRKREASRTVNYFTLMYTVQSTHQAYDGIQLLGEGWYTVEAIARDDGPASSIVRCVERASLRNNKRHDISLLSGIVAEQYDAHFERVQNKLMDDTVRRRAMRHDE